MHLGVVVLPEQRWAAARAVWQRAEALGFAHAWTYDHLSWRTLRDGPWFAALPVLVAAATVTDSIRLGTLVASPNFRHPVTFAKEMVALDDVSGGRAIAGVGSGGTGWDATTLGGSPLSPSGRADRFAEFVEALDLLLRAPAASYNGAHYTAVEARTFPGCVQQPRLPLAIAATGPRGLALAARHGEFWVTTGDGGTGAPALAAQVARLAQACRDAGRDPSTMRRLVVLGPVLPQPCSSPDELEDAVARYAEAGVTDLVLHWPRPSQPYAGDVATFERVVGEVLARLSR